MPHAWSVFAFTYRFTYRHGYWHGPAGSTYFILRQTVRHLHIGLSMYKVLTPYKLLYMGLCMGILWAHLVATGCIEINNCFRLRRYVVCLGSYILWSQLHILTSLFTIFVATSKCPKPSKGFRCVSSSQRTIPYENMSQEIDACFSLIT